MQKLGNKKGFTLVELSLSLAFIGVLAITIVLIINDAIATYRRGLMLDQINTVGMNLVDDIRTAVRNSPGNLPDSCNEEGKECVLVRKEADLEVDGKSIEDAPVWGAFCTGTYSYIWNSGYLFKDGIGVSRASLEGFGNDFRLIKVRDKSRSICLEYDENGADVFKLEDASDLDKKVQILIANDNNSNLVLYDLFAPYPTVSDASNLAFYSVSFILGTIQGGINVKASGNYCSAPAESDSNFDYCAINKFNFAVQAGGENG